MSVAAIKIEGAIKTFGDRKALNGASLVVNAGEMVALIGPSGSGKSTLLRAAAGLMELDVGGGTVETAGGPVQANGKLSDDVRVSRTRIGFVAQQFNLVGRLTLFANILIGALGRIPVWRGALGAFNAQEREGAMLALNRVGMADFAARRASTLSGGQQQRGAVARALFQGAKVLLADEPIASLDPVSARRVMELLHGLNRDEGLTVLVTLHQVDHAKRWCQRIVALKDGKIVYDGPGKGLDRATLIEIYGPEIEDALADEEMAA